MENGTIGRLACVLPGLGARRRSYCQKHNACDSDMLHDEIRHRLVSFVFLVIVTGHLLREVACLARNSIAMR